MLLHTTGVYAPTLYEQPCGFFYFPQESEVWKSCDTGPKVFLSQHILHSYFETLSVGPAEVWTGAYANELAGRQQ